jgi:hypothetical protein
MSPAITTIQGGVFQKINSENSTTANTKSWREKMDEVHSGL